MKINNTLFKNFAFLISCSLLFIIGLNAIFARSFVGVTIYGFRIGELEVAGALILSFIFLISFKNFQFSIGKSFDFYFRLIIISYFFVVFATNTDLTNEYAIKSSSYIWTVSFIFLGRFIYIQMNESMQYLSFLFFITPLAIYIMASGNYPNFIMQFFIDYSDKFQFLKASDILIAIIASYFLIKKSKIGKSYEVFFLFFFCPLFLPVLMKLSRGSYLGIIIFILFELYYQKNVLLNEKKKTLVYALFSVLLFSFSTYRMTGIQISSETISTQNIASNLEEITKHKNTTKAFFSFYINEYGYLDSWDATTSWRLDIWQDVLTDMYKENNLLTGYGYKEILPQMLDPAAPGRLGRDGLNEHVHNYFVTIISRGGVFQLILFLLLHLQIIKVWKEKYKNFQIISFIAPLIFVSLLDISLDGVQFPLIYFSTLGYLLSDLDK